MTHSDALIFASLFKDGYEKCFGHTLQAPLTEAESKLFGNEILDQTGLVIGWKSIKNYSFYILNEAAGKPENPSMATLDTFARYVLNAPYTDEIQRKNKEDHYPYWFQYKDQYYKIAQKNVPEKELSNKNKWISFAGLAVLLITLLIVLNPFSTKKPAHFTYNFKNITAKALHHNDWLVQAKDTTYWNRRNENPKYLTLFTLRGDNWSDSANAPRIKNLLLRKVKSDCFTTEVHLKNFVPRQNWQQAGIILLEDTNFVGKSVRLSLAYNDFSGGFPTSKEIIIQAITSLGNDFSKPEEIAHKLLFNLNETSENLIIQNLENVALRIEKQGKKIRLLYANGSMENTAFKELTSQEFDIQPHYIGLFALKGFVNDAAEIPVHFYYFSLNINSCKE